MHWVGWGGWGTGMWGHGREGDKINVLEIEKGVKVSGDPISLLTSPLANVGGKPCETNYKLYKSSDMGWEGTCHPVLLRKP